MEMLVMGLIAIVAFAAVLIPLFRRRPGAGDAREFEGPSGATETGGVADTGVSADTPAASVAERLRAGETAAISSDEPVTADELELEVQRYRTAVRAGTVCRKCGQANPADSTFCFDCGERLPRDDAKEFE